MTAPGSASTATALPHPTSLITGRGVPADRNDNAGGLVFSSTTTVTPDVKGPQGSSQLLESGTVSDDSKYVLPKCRAPPPEEFQTVETFVAKAVREQHDNSRGRNDAVPVVDAYRGIVEALRKRDDPPMLHKLLLALRTAGGGSTLNYLTCSSSRHARLIHLIVRFDPFFASSVDENKSTTSSPPWAGQALADLCCDVADAHLHLVLAIVSSNSVFLVPALTSLWKLLTSEYDNLPEER